MLNRGAEYELLGVVLAGRNPLLNLKCRDKFIFHLVLYS